MKKFIASTLLMSPVLAFAQLLSFVTYTSVGSQSDAAIRFFAPLIAEQLGQDYVVKNLPGAGGAIGLREVKSMPADGNTIMIGSASIAHLVESKVVEFDAFGEFVPLYGASNSAALVVVPANSPVRNLKDLKALSEQKGGLNGGSFSPLNNIVFQQLDAAVGTKTQPIGYTQASMVGSDLAGGRLDYTVTAVGNAATAGLITSGHIRPIAVIGEARTRHYADVSTMAEQGYKTIVDFSWSAFFTHAAVPTDRRKALEAAIAKAVNSAAGAKYEERDGGPSRFLKDAKAVRKVQTSEVGLIKNFVAAQTEKPPAR